MYVRYNGILYVEVRSKLYSRVQFYVLLFTALFSLSLSIGRERARNILFFAGGNYFSRGKVRSEIRSWLKSTMNG